MTRFEGRVGCRKNLHKHTHLYCAHEHPPAYASPGPHVSPLIMKWPGTVLILLLVCLIGEVTRTHETEPASESKAASWPSLCAHAEDEYHQTWDMHLELDKRRAGGGRAGGAAAGAGVGAAAGAHRYHDPHRNTTSSAATSPPTSSAAPTPTHTYKNGVSSIGITTTLTASIVMLCALVVSMV